jgi:iron-sulfur cluster assembly accessory protein
MITLSQTAADHFKKLMEQDGSTILQISLEAAGCVGYKYCIELVKTYPVPSMVMISNGVMIVIDPLFESMLYGLHIDFVNEGLQQVLKYTNPNEQTRCGCGKSFGV